MTKLWIKAVASLLLVAALIGAAMWGMEYFREQGRKELRTKYALALAKAKDDARAITDQLRMQRDKAQELANEREKTIRTMAAASGAAANGLRDELAALRRGLPADSAETARQRADALADLLGQCTARYRELAEKADRHANDTQKLSDSWPQK